jgi:hypothetical protein
MARRASSSFPPGLLIGAAVAVILIIIGGKLLMGKKSSSFGDVAKLDVQDLLENGNSLRGNEYVIEGLVDEKLRWDGDNGQVVSVKVTDSGGEEFVGIEVPPELSKVNIERKQRYAFRVKFKQGGIPVATAIERL